MKTSKNDGLPGFDDLDDDDDSKHSKRIHVDPDDDFDSKEDLPDDDGKDLPPIIDGEFEELDDDEVDKEFDSKKHYEDLVEDDDDDE